MIFVAMTQPGAFLDSNSKKEYHYLITQLHVVHWRCTVGVNIVFVDDYDFFVSVVVEVTIVL